MEAERKDTALSEQTEFIINSVQRIDVIFPELPRMINLRRIVIRNCNIDDKLAILLAEAMKNCIHLTIFDVQHNCIREKGFQAIIQRVRTLPLRLLQFSGGNQMSTSNLRELLKLPPPLNPRDSIKHRFLIEGQKYEEVGVLSFTRLDLAGMNLGDEGAKVLANSFSVMVRLKSLIFSENEVGEEGANALLQNLPKAHILEYLNLEHNFISPECVEKFIVANRTRVGTGLSQVCVDLTGQRASTNDEEAKAIAIEIPSMKDGTIMDFSSKGKKFTSHGKSLIELANGMRKIFELQPLKIIF